MLQLHRCHLLRLWHPSFPWRRLDQWILLILSRPSHPLVPCRPSRPSTLWGRLIQSHPWDRFPLWHLLDRSVLLDPWLQLVRLRPLIRSHR